MTMDAIFAIFVAKCYAIKKRIKIDSYFVFQLNKKDCKTYFKIVYRSQEIVCFIYRNCIRIRSHKAVLRMDYP